MSRSKRRFGRKSALNEDMVLQITSMADVFTILLVFLLKSFSTGVSNISPSGKSVLPEAGRSDEVVERLKLEVSPDSVILDDRPVTRLTGFKFEVSDLETDGTSRSLNMALIALKQKKPDAGRAPSSAPAGTEPTPENLEETDRNRVLMLLADQKTPYSTLKTVMNSAANQGFPRFKLVVVQEK